MLDRREPGSDEHIEAQLRSASFAANPHPTYHRLREVLPVYWHEASQQWLVTSFDLVDAVLGDPLTFSSVGAERSHVDALGEEAVSATPVLRSHFATSQLNIADPPEHTRIRRAFARHFLPREVRRYEPQISAIVARLLDAAGPRVDVVSDLADPLPVEVIAMIIGVPEEHRPRIPVITMDQRRFFGTTPPTRQHAQPFDLHLREWHDLLVGWIDERRTTPSDDVLSRVAVSIDEGTLDIDEAVATCLHLVIAGNSTTTALIGNAIFLLLDHPDQLDVLSRSPELVSNCVEETLRYEAPLPRDRRIATRDVRLGEADIRAGDRVSAVLAAANRDPDHFAEPDVFDIARQFTAGHHASFGRGIHFCLGAPVARLETAVALSSFFERFPQPRLAPGFIPDWHSITTHHGLTNLPVDTSRSAA
jgi:cytochrome P450